MGPGEVRTPLSMLLIVAADVGLHQFFGRPGWSLPSNVAGMVGLFAGLVGLDRIAPSYAERVVRVLEPGSAEFSRWLPVVLVPSLVQWIFVPLASLTGSSASLAEVVVTAAKAAARHAAGRVSKDYWYAFSRFPAGGKPSGSRLRAVANVAKVLLTGAGGWLAHLGSTTVVVSVLSWLSSPSSPASRSASITPATPAAVSSKFPTESVRRTTRGGLFDARLVRRLGTGTVALGAASVTLFALFSSMPFSFGLFVVVFLVPAIVGAHASMGLATLFGYSAGHVGVSPGGALASRRSALPWKAALLPLATSMAATAVTGASVAALSGADISLMLELYFLQDGTESRPEIGASSVLYRPLGPAVLSFAAPLLR
ncbi:unnamed protein product [Ectocarpus sp. 13 AM-2016]